MLQASCVALLFLLCDLVVTCTCVYEHMYSVCTVYVIPVSFLSPDTSLTPLLLVPVLSTVTVRDFWGALLFLLGVPDLVIDQIRLDPSYSSEDEKRMVVLQYSLQTVPGVSWGRIAGVLWFLEEHTALETVRPYLPHKPGEYTCTCYILPLALS